MATKDVSAPVFIDSHAHLADPAFAGDSDEVIARARDAGAAAVVCIGESLEAARVAAVLAGDNSDFIYSTAGIHPHDAAEFDAGRDLPRLRKLVHDGAVAIGECGLDYHYDNSPREAQRAAFSAQVSMAAEMHLPIVVHTRDAAEDTRAELRHARTLGVVGVLHCYTGSAQLAEFALDAGWYVSFSGIITFRKWTDLALLKLIPRNRLLVESDSPYLAPVPHRGKRNEPAWVVHTLDRLAEVRGEDSDGLGRTTAENAARLFGLAFSVV